MKDFSASEIVASLRSAPMFSALDEAAIRKLLTNCRKLSFRAGAMIFMPTEKAERFFVVLAGKVKIFKLSPKGDEQILHLYGPGETFAEAAMWAGTTYPAHAEALADATLLAIDRRTLRDAIAGNPDLAIGMMAGLSSKLREFNLLIEQISLKEVPSRLAGVLVKLSRQKGSRSFRLPLSKRQLAAQIAAAPETLSRALAKLKKDGVLEVTGSEIRILDLEALVDLAEGG